ncbi:MAG: hypothetical protein WA159_14305 [Variovorax sp.]
MKSASLLAWSWERSAKLRESHELLTMPENAASLSGKVVGFAARANCRAVYGGDVGYRRKPTRKARPLQ